MAIVRDHFTKSLPDVHKGLRGWVERCPKWLQPPLFGAILIYGFVIWRGGLIVIPVLCLLSLFGSPSDRESLGRALLAILVIAPAGGFAGGLLVSLMSPVLTRLGMSGKYLQFIIGTWVYCLVLVFGIVPVVKPADRLPLSSPAGWIISGFMAIVFGLVGAYTWYQEPGA